MRREWYNMGAMKIRYQSKVIETSVATLGALLAEMGARNAVVEMNGDFIPPGKGLDRPLAEGDSIEVFAIVGGG